MKRRLSVLEDFVNHKEDKNISCEDSFFEMNREIKTIVSCPCCEKLFIENCRYNKQWNEHRERSDFKQFRKYLDLVLSRRNTRLMTKGTHMKLGEREVSNPEENAAPQVKDRKSLLYQAEFIAEKKRENFLRNEDFASRKIKDFERQGKLERKCERDKKMGNKLKNDLVITSYDKDLVRFDDNDDDLEMNSAEEKSKLERQRGQMWLPKTSQKSQLLESRENGSAVVRFTNHNVKLDVYLPPLT